MHLRNWAISSVIALSFLPSSFGQITAPATVPAVSPEELSRRMESVRQHYRGSSDKLEIADLRLVSSAVPVFGRMEAQFTLIGRFDNPFDPDQINVEALITRPDGKTVTVPAFFIEPYEPVLGMTQMTADVNYRHAGPAGWRVRYAPDAVGNYRIVIQAKDARGQQARSPEQEFAAQPSDNKGFVQVSSTNPMYFENSADNSLFWAVGANVAWTRIDEVNKGIKGPASYEHYFDRAKGKMTATRVWLCHWAWLEWTPQRQGFVWPAYGGAGYYNQMIATAMDRVFDLAEAQNLRIMLVTEDNNELFTTGVPYGVWAGHPYNVVNGGPCEKPMEIFENPQARKLYRNRLRYIMARWGYSTSLWAIDSMNDYVNPTPGQLDWVKDVAAYVHQVFNGWRPIIYGSNLRFAASQYTDYRQATGQPDTSKPNVIQECYYTAIPNLFRQELHEQLWSGFGRGLAGIMVWDHTLVDRTDSWDEFAPLMSFAQSLPLNKHPWKPIQAQVVSAKASESGPFLRATVMRPYGDVPNWGARATRDRFDVDLAETNQWLEGFAPLIYGERHEKEGWRSEPVFSVNMPAAGKFMIEGSEIGSKTNTLIGSVRAGDNDPWRELTARTFEEGRRDLKADEQWIEIPLAKGPNQVKLGAKGDWFRISRIIVTQDQPAAAALVDLSGWTDGSYAFLYLQNLSHSRLLSDTLKQKRVNMSEVSVSLPGLGDGEYRVQICSTDDGTTLSESTGRSSGGLLTVNVPQLTRDVAIRIAPASAPTAP